MRNFIVLFFAGFVVSTNGLLPGLGTNLLGGVVGGGDPAGAAINQANGLLPGLTSGPIVSVPDVLGIPKNKECIKLCAIKIADKDKKCVKPTDFLKTPRCYQINSRNIYIWPCTNNGLDE